MKYAKILGLLAVAAAALMAFAGSASATTLTTSSDGVNFHNSTVGTVIHASNEGNVTLDGAVSITCTGSTVAGEVTNIGSDTTTVKGSITTLDFSGCNHTVTVLANGTLELHTTTANTDGNGILTSSGARVTVLTHGGIIGTTHCLYETNGTLIGHVTGSDTTTATLDIDSAALPIVNTDFGCGFGTAEWTGKYINESPMYLTVH